MIPDPTLTNAEIDKLLERFDQTAPRLQRRIIAEFAARAALADDLQRQRDALRAALESAADQLAAMAAAELEEYIPRGSDCNDLARRLLAALARCKP